MKSVHVLSRRNALTAMLAIGACPVRSWAQAAADDPWPSLVAQIFEGRAMQDGSGVLSIDAPYRAEDAALVPIAIRSLLPAASPPFRKITLVIDQNPSPLAAVFSPGAQSGLRFVSTRVRVDSYTQIHAVAESTDGTLFMTERFVKAAGGCSAPAAKQEAGAVPLGAMRFRQFDTAPEPGLQEAQFMIRHPNYSGMQMDQLTRLYVPAHFVTSVHLWQGDEPLLMIESGISISENPAFRFGYHPSGAAEFRAEVQDSEGKVFTQTWQPAPV